ncbi:MAG: MarR family transcriptional regulator [Sporocytophaga sp.]|uniref:MarR family winged helix-turn-helix transcriptional regulator n=1 Tax=Sporocytophaga sp. TaxID=2231183 RepID=UPI001B1AD2C7|nr:MarR family transcriptional regulator [Sporocytophaga sp.]MBO9703113.1 MarR family transcriptional regulator [Sporocytophaga sp.]
MDIKELPSSLRSTIAAFHKGLRKQIYSSNAYSMTEWQTIGLLNKNTSMLPTELASQTMIKTQSMSQILKKFEEQGIIKRTPSKEDKRKVYISLTSTGKKLVDKTIYDRDEWLKEAIEKSLSEKEKELLIKVIPVLNKLIDNR